MPSTMRRKFGIEMEGYMNRSPNLIRISNAQLKRDASLRNSSWDYDYSDYGVEVVSEPIQSLRIVETIFTNMQRHSWHVDERAGTHVHIDIADFTGFDKAKLLRFCKGIERIIFMFVKNYRNGNRFCKNLSDDWRKIFKPIKRTRSVMDSRGMRRRREVASEPINLINVHSERLMSMLNNSGLQVENSKYYWLNIYGSRHGTAEFRIFHAVENIEEIKAFITMAHNIVELVKNSSPEQLEFIILSLYESKSVQEMRRNFFQVLNMGEFSLPMVGGQAKVYMENKLGKGGKKARSATGSDTYTYGHTGGIVERPAGFNSDSRRLGNIMRRGY